MRKYRNSNLEILRILSILGVIILHYNEDICNALSLVSKISFESFFLVSLEEVAIIAVNIFVIITGYYSIEKKEFKLTKIIYLLLEVILINVATYLIDSMIHNNFSLRSLFGAFIPNNWFVILYVVLLVISPFINKLVSVLDKKNYFKLLVVSFILFSIYPMIVDIIEALNGNPFRGLSSISIEGSIKGYSIVQFILMYLLGGYIRKYPINKGKSIYKVFGICCCWLVLFVWAFLDYYYNRPLLCNEYCNPLIIVFALLVFSIFIGMKERNNSIINEIAKGSFTVYLVHPFLLKIIDFEKYNISDWKVIVLLIIILPSIYFVGWIVAEIYDFFAKRIISKIDSKIKLSIYVE